MTLVQMTCLTFTTLAGIPSRLLWNWQSPFSFLTSRLFCLKALWVTPAASLEAGTPHRRRPNYLCFLHHPLSTVSPRWQSGRHQSRGGLIRSLQPPWQFPPPPGGLLIWGRKFLSRAPGSPGARPYFWSSSDSRLFFLSKAEPAVL